MQPASLCLSSIYVWLLYLISTAALNHQQNRVTMHSMMYFLFITATRTQPQFSFLLSVFSAEINDFSTVKQQHTHTNTLLHPLLFLVCRSGSVGCLMSHTPSRTERHTHRSWLTAENTSLISVQHPHHFTTTRLISPTECTHAEDNQPFCLLCRCVGVCFSQLVKQQPSLKIHQTFFPSV